MSASEDSLEDGGDENLKRTLKKDCRINIRKSHTDVRLYTRKNKLLNMVDEEDV